LFTPFPSLLFSSLLLGFDLGADPGAGAGAGAGEGAGAGAGVGAGAGAGVGAGAGAGAPDGAAISFKPTLVELERSVVSSVRSVEFLLSESTALDESPGALVCAGDGASFSKLETLPAPGSGIFFKATSFNFFAGDAFPDGLTVFCSIN
jgi:hypothetical protein